LKVGWCQLKRNNGCGYYNFISIKTRGCQRISKQNSNIRKDSGFEVTDKIKVQLKRNGILEEAILVNEAYIKSETLTSDLVLLMH
jgi:isoleucyl-tRNA synthetase